jgi:phytoene synthase
MPDNSRKADLAACRALMRGGSRSFFAASHLLPRRVYEPATALYAFCRLADDAIDDGPAKQDALGALRHRLDRAYAGYPHEIAADRAFADVVARFHVPRALPLALLDGFGWDAEGRRYQTLDDLLDYAARVAGSVGAMMAVLMGVRTPYALARACDLGVAMQLTNIARDVGEDARAGRLYLPLDWFAAAGLDPDSFLAQPRCDGRLAGIVERLLRTADTLYARGAAGIAALPRSCRPGIRAAGLIYADIGQVLARNDHDSVSRRAHVPATRKLALLGRSLLATPALPAAHGAALPACQYLVDAAICEPTPARRFAPAVALDARVTWLFDLFERLHDQQWEAS